ncbi:PilZ domain-containing protein [Thiorhodovibrio winogradskyi]|uniref:PilZ domain-containing protein n=1 Tax=Thiorhodovibrio winogradskyi TaxID=77007 RepID=UPI002E2E1C00|nr:PilZ domain-containing protein [Thiorhodovibrio winogradskyi]
MATDTDGNRRRFQRIGLDREVRVEAMDQETWCRLVDISLRGLLLEACGNWRPVLGQLVDLSVVLDEQGSCQIQVKGEVRHLDAKQIGVHVLEMDLDSVALLRRLIEVNLDDDSRLDVELQAMLVERETKD